LRRCAGTSRSKESTTPNYFFGKEAAAPVPA
jgi:hypothetical protein